MKFGLVFLLFFCFALPSFGSFDSIYVDSSRHFDQYELERYKANSDFSYIHESQVVHWWTGIYEWIASVLSEWFEDKDPKAIDVLLSIILKIILWSLLIFAIGMLAYSLYKNGVFGVIGRKRQSLDLAFSDLEDKVLETDWQELIRKAIGDKQYNVAIRLLFLQLLQSLNHANKIEWKKSKSIRDYQRELSTPDDQEFSALAKYYQYSWFGDVQVDESHFNEVHGEFKSFDRSLNVE